MDTWDDKQTGQKRTRLRVVADNMQLLEDQPYAGGADATGRKAKPAHHLKNRRLPNRTKTRFRFEGSASLRLGPLD